MGAALVAVVHREQRHIVLDPAVRPGTRLDGDAERLLLHTTSEGTCEETAQALAAILRSDGWHVIIRRSAADALAPLARTNGTGPGMLSDGAAALLAQQVEQQIRQQPKGDPQPAAPPRARRVANGMRWVCTTCWHVTMNGPGRESHERNRGHFEYLHMRHDDAHAYATRMRAQAPPPTDDPESPEGAG